MPEPPLTAQTQDQAWGSDHDSDLYDGRFVREDGPAYVDPVPVSPELWEGDPPWSYMEWNTSAGRSRLVAVHSTGPTNREDFRRA